MESGIPLKSLEPLNTYWEDVRALHCQLSTLRKVPGEARPGFSVPSASEVASTPRLDPRIVGLAF